MKKKYLLPVINLLLIVLLSATGNNKIFAQTNSGGADTLINTTDSVTCSGAVILNTGVLGGIPNSIPLNVDDAYSGVLPIGFTFNFYGNNYTQCVLSANGYISFNTGNAGAYSAWSLVGTGLSIPGNPNCVNSFCGVYSDILPQDGGSIYYSTLGTAPNRKFVVTFCNTPMFSCTSQIINFQMILYETSNIMECHISQKYLCTGWNGALAIQGVQNATGTAAVTTPGRNNTQWTATDDAVRFSPDTVSNTISYTEASIPYNPIPNADATIFYYQGNTYIGSGSTVTVYPTDTTTYTIVAVSCGDTTTSYKTVNAGPEYFAAVSPHIDTARGTNPTACTQCNGIITIHGVKPGLYDTILYTYNGIAQPPIPATAGADSILTITNLCAGVYTNVRIKVGDCYSNPFADTLVYPLFTLTDSYTNPSVCGACDGTIRLINVPYPNQPDTVYYTYNGIQQSPVVITSDSSSVTTLTNLCDGEYSNIYLKTPTCTSIPVGPITLVNPPYNVDTSYAVNPTSCGHCDGRIVFHGLPANHVDTLFYTLNGIQQPPVSFVSDAGENIVFNNLCAGTYSDFVFKMFTCTTNVPLTYTLVTEAPVAAFTDTIHYACTGDTVLFTNLSTPNNDTDYHYTWHFGDNTVDSDNTINPVHVYTAQGIYHPTLVFSNGYCTDSITHDVILIHPLVASYTVDRDSICLDQSIAFTNTSITTNGPYNVGPTYLWTFGDNTATDTNANVAHRYTQPGDFGTKLVVTDFVPCMDSASREVYVGTFNVNIEAHDTSFCIMAPYQIKTDITSPTPDLFSSYTYQWSPAESLADPTVQSPVFNDTGDHHYVVTVTGNPIGCVYTDSVTLHAHPPITLVNVTPSQTIVYGSSLQLNASGAYYYNWTPANGTLSNPNIANPVATPLDTVTYMVRGMSFYGCADSATVSIGIDFSMNEFIPTAFTPNGDGRNDQFKVMNIKYQKLLDFRVFNRWGQVVYHSTDPDQGWDGTFNGVPQEIGDYNYMVIIARPDGTEKSYKGTVTLIR